MMRHPLYSRSADIIAIVVSNVPVAPVCSTRFARTCSLCHGSGETEIYDAVTWRAARYETCDECGGSGTRIMGRVAR